MDLDSEVHAYVQVLISCRTLRAATNIVAIRRGVNSNIREEEYCKVAGATRNSELGGRLESDVLIDATRLHRTLRNL